MGNPVKEKERKKPQPIRAVFLGLMLILSVAAVCATNTRNYEQDRTYSVLSISPIPLSPELFHPWALEAERIAKNRILGRIKIPFRSLAEFILWGRMRPDLLEDCLHEMEPEMFLGITLSIDSARSLYRSTVEHDKRLAEAEALVGSMDTQWDMVFFPEAPVFEAKAQADMEAYLREEILVENTLFTLLPTLPPLLPEWGDLDEPDEKEPAQKQEPKVLNWRKVNPSRYGPRILRNN